MDFVRTWLAPNSSILTRCRERDAQNCALGGVASAGGFPWCWLHPGESPPIAVDSNGAYLNFLDCVAIHRGTTSFMVVLLGSQARLISMNGLRWAVKAKHHNCSSNRKEKHYKFHRQREKDLNCVGRYHRRHHRCVSALLTPRPPRYLFSLFSVSRESHTVLFLIGMNATDLL